MAKKAAAKEKKPPTAKKVMKPATRQASAKALAPDRVRKAATAAAKEVEAILKPGKKMALAEVGATEDIRQSACRTYHEYRGYVDPLLDWIAYIPGPGDTVVKVVRILERIADLVCPASEFASLTAKLTPALAPVKVKKRLALSAGATVSVQAAAENAARAIEKELQAQNVAPPAGALGLRAAAFSFPTLGEICPTYQKIKTYIDPLLPWVEGLGDTGKTVAKVVRILEELADVACPLKEK